jgi:hypothetical protein
LYRRLGEPAVGLDTVLEKDLFPFQESNICYTDRGLLPPMLCGRLSLKVIMIFSHVES